MSWGLPGRATSRLVNPLLSDPESNGFTVCLAGQNQNPILILTCWLRVQPDCVAEVDESRESICCTHPTRRLLPGTPKSSKCLDNNSSRRRHKKGQSDHATRSVGGVLPPPPPSGGTGKRRLRVGSCRSGCKSTTQANRKPKEPRTATGANGFSAAAFNPHPQTTKRLPEQKKTAAPKKSGIRHIAASFADPSGCALVLLYITLFVFIDFNGANFVIFNRN